MTVRIAMWSGPRNISTAMMRSFENRDDTFVIDEPFYAYYLDRTGLQHPMAQDVLANQPTDWAAIAAELTTTAQGEIYYQKHMTHHMLKEIDLDWTKQLQNCFLIRDPKYVVNSYSKKRSSVSQDDIGIKRQFELYEEISNISGQNIPVIDAKQFLMNPELNLRRLCNQFDIPFIDDMLSWPKGHRKTDGVWGRHWYGAVESSTGFQVFSEPDINLTAEQQAIADEANEYYKLMLSKCQTISEE